MVQVVGALIRDSRNRVYAQRRSGSRKLLPGIWDVVGGHVEPGETLEQALAREIEETGWRLRRIESVVREWDWTIDGVTRHETDYLVEVDGDLANPRLEEGMHDANSWVGPDTLELMMVGRTDGDRRLRDIVAETVRTRLTSRLRLVPMGRANAGDLWRVHQDEAIAAWYWAGSPRPRPWPAPSGRTKAGNATESTSGWPTTASRGSLSAVAGCR